MKRRLAGWARAAALATLAAGRTDLVTASPPSVAAGDPIRASDPFVRVYRDSDGLPQNTVHALALDASGYLWAGTQDGLARYDGRAWRRESPPAVNGALFVRDLLAAADGALWVATQAHGLLLYSDGVWREVPAVPAELVRQRINALAETGAGSARTLWVGTHDRGLFAYSASGWRRIDEAQGLPSSRVWSLAPDGASRLWIGTQRGVASVDPAEGAIERPPGAPLASVSSLEVTREHGGAVLWVGTYGDGLHRLDASGWTRLGETDGLPSLFVTDLARRVDDPDEVWIATDGGGLAWADARTLELFEVGPQFASRAAYRLLETTEAEGGEALWVGTRNGGLLRVTERLWRTLRPPTDSPSPVSALLVASSDAGEDELWVGTDGDGLALWRGGEWRRFDRAAGELSEDVVLALLATSDLGGGRRVWVGTRNGGLDVWNGSAWTRHDAASGALPSDLVQALAEVPTATGSSELWVGTREGLALFDGSAWSRPAAAGGWPSSSILALEVDRDVAPPAVWIGTSEGLWRAQRGSLRQWRVEDGLPHPSVQALHLRRAARGRRELWIGTDGGGLALLDPDRPDVPVRVAPDPAVPELANPVVYALVEDRNGHLYASTNQGVSRFRSGVEGGVVEREDFLVFHGLPVHQGSRGAAAVDERGRVWIGTVGGVAVLDPQRERRDTTPNRVLLEARLPRAEDAPLRLGASVPAAAAEIVFTYRLLSFVGEPLTRFRTELAGGDGEMSEWSAVAERTIAGLAPGDYVFRVWGRDAAGNVSHPAALEFRVAPSFWQRLWVRSLGGLALLGAVAASAHWRVRVHQRRARLLEQTVAERTAQLAKANELLARLSFLDPVTGIANRRRFDETLESEWRRAVRLGTPLALVMIDIDEFKALNDSYGHPRGDEVLRDVAEVLGEGLPRSGDLLARFGGEEFAVLLPATDVAGAAGLAEELRARVAAAGIAHGASRVAPHLTVSCGVAAATPIATTGASALVGAADGALYAAKRNGRNRVELARG